MKLWQTDLAKLSTTVNAAWLATLAPQLAAWQPHGDWSKWANILSALPQLPAGEVTLTDTVSVGPRADAGMQKRLHAQLQQLMPWRKGPFNLFGVEIDTEWRSDWKWQRLRPALGSLTGQQVLDVGCGSGYHLWRMLEAGASDVWGIDPGQLFMAQFLAIRHFMPESIAARAHFFPVGIEAMPPQLQFDTVFSMGVLYHRRSPLEFLQQLRNQLKPGGRLVLETLVVNGDSQTVLVPGERYANMRNVWFIPSTAALMHWLERLKFVDIELIDLNQTSCDEQRRTQWMNGESLSDFLDPNDSNLTIEGYQAPLRAVIMARSK